MSRCSCASCSACCCASCTSRVPRWLCSCSSRRCASRICPSAALACPELLEPDAAARPHRIGRLPHLLRRLREIRTVALARELLELPRGFLRLVGKLPLAVAAALAHLAGQRLLALPLGFLLLAPRQLAQLLHHRIDLLVGLLLLRALRRLVLIGELVQILLEEVRQVLGDRTGAAPAATTAAAHRAAG